MLARSLGPTLALALVASLPAPASAQANGTGIREVSATGRSLITLQTRLRYTTMVLLPDGEEILDVICGDRDFWVITATHNIAHVKPAKEGAATNMNLVTASGAVYSKYYSAAQLEELRSELEQARAATDAANRRTTEALAAYQQEYPGKLQFVYGPQRYTKPFLVRSIWNDGQFTYIKSDATELPALYELKDGKPGLLNFQVQNGTYIVPKVLDRGYLSLGKDRFEFLQEGR